MLALGCLANCVERDARVYEQLVGKELSTEAEGSGSEQGVSQQALSVMMGTAGGGGAASATASSSSPPPSARESLCQPLAYLTWMLAQLLGRMGFIDAAVVGAGGGVSSREGSPRDGRSPSGEGKAAASEALEDVCDPDDAVIAGYLTLLLGCCLKYETKERREASGTSSSSSSSTSAGGTSAVLQWLGRLVQQQQRSASGALSSAAKPATAKSVRTSGANAMSYSLRAFVVLQSNAGMLTEEMLSHVSDVQATLEQVLEAPSGSKSRSGSPHFMPAAWKLAGGSLRDWLADEDDEEEGKTTGLQ